MSVGTDIRCVRLVAPAWFLRAAAFLTLAVVLSVIAATACEPSGSTAPAQQWGNVTGVVRAAAAVPEPEAKNVRYRSVDGSIETRQYKPDTLLVDPESLGIANVLVWLVKAADDDLPVHPAQAELPPIELIIEEGRWKPRVLVARTSQRVSVRSADTLHHAEGYVLVGFVQPIAYFPSPSGQPYSRVFGRSERVPSIIRCVIHPWETGVLFVQDHPWFAVTDDQGRFEIRNIPAGQHTFRFWHEKVGSLSDATTMNGRVIAADGSLEINVVAPGVDVGTITAGTTGLPGGQEEPQP